MEQALAQAIANGAIGGGNGRAGSVSSSTAGIAPLFDLQQNSPAAVASVPARVEDARLPPLRPRRDSEVYESYNSPRGNRLSELADLAVHASGPPATGATPAAAPADGFTAATPGPGLTTGPAAQGQEEGGIGGTSKISGQAGRLQYDEDRNLRYIGPSATVTLVLDAHSALDGSNRPGANGDGVDTTAAANLGWVTSSLGVNLSKVLPSVESVTFPERDLSDTLVRTFFDCIHPLFPVLDEREFNLRYAELFNQATRTDAIGADGGNVAAAAPKADGLFIASLFAVYACASRIVQDPRVCPMGKEAQLYGYDARATAGKPSNGNTRKEETVNFALAGVQFFARSQLLALHKSQETRVEQVQTHALLAYYMASSNCAARAWLIIGQALRMACDLGLHRNLTHLGLDYHTLEIRRRVWWNVYILDRLLSVSLGRPLGIEDASVDQELPSLEFQPPFPLAEGFRSIVELVRLQSDIAKNAFQRQVARQRNDAAALEVHHMKAREYVKAVDQWFQVVPAHLKTGNFEAGSPLAMQTCVAFILYRSTSMLLHRSFLQGGLVSASRNISNRSPEEREALSECSKTATTLIKAAPRIAGSLPASPFLLEYAQQLLVAGGYLALNAWRFRGTDAAQEHLTEAAEACLALHGLEPIFPSARALRRVLDSVIRKLKSRLDPSRATTEQSRASRRARQEDRAETTDAGADAAVDADAWAKMLNSSMDFTKAPNQEGGVGGLLNGAQSETTPGTSTFNMPNPFGGLDFQGLEWLESLLGASSAESSSSEASAADMFSANLWE